MAQITIEAAAHVLGMQPGQQMTVEDTPHLRGAIRGGTLRLVRVHPDPPAGAGVLVDEAVDRHPAGKLAAAATAVEGDEAL